MSKKHPHDAPEKLTGAERHAPHESAAAFEKRTGLAVERDAAAVALPSVCRAVVVFSLRAPRNAEGEVEGDLHLDPVKGLEVPAVVQRAKDGLVIDCYCVGDLNIDGDGERGGLHELRGIRHESDASRDGVFWAYPTRV